MVAVKKICEICNKEFRTFNDIYLCSNCRDEYKFCEKCSKRYGKNYFENHKCISEKKCKLCNETDLSKFKTNYGICRVCYNNRQTERIECDNCKKSFSRNYINKHKKICL